MYIIDGVHVRFLPFTLCQILLLNTPPVIRPTLLSEEVTAFFLHKITLAQRELTDKLGLRGER